MDSTYSSPRHAKTILLESSVDIHPSETGTDVNSLLVERYLGLLEILHGNGDAVLNARCTSPCCVATTFDGKRALVQPSDQYHRGDIEGFGRLEDAGRVYCALLSRPISTGEGVVCRRTFRQDVSLTEQDRKRRTLSSLSIYDTSLLRQRL